MCVTGVVSAAETTDAHVEAAQHLRAARGSASPRSPGRRTPSPPCGTRWSPAARAPCRPCALCAWRAMLRRRRDSAPTNQRSAGPTSERDQRQLPVEVEAARPSSPTMAIESFTSTVSTRSGGGGDAGDVVGDLREQHPRAAGRRRTAPGSASAARTSRRAGRAPLAGSPSAGSTTEKKVSTPRSRNTPMIAAANHARRQRGCAAGAEAAVEERLDQRRKQRLGRRGQDHAELPRARTRARAAARSPAGGCRARGFRGSLVLIGRRRAATSRCAMASMREALGGGARRLAHAPVADGLVSLLHADRARPGASSGRAHPAVRRRAR